MNKDLEQAKALLENNEEYTCAACRAGESFASEEHGIRPLMRWLNEGTDLSGASAADRIVGKAAAFLYVLLGVRTVYAPLMSVPARETLRAHGALAALMTGSGAAVFGVFADEAPAQAAKAALLRVYPQCWVLRPEAKGARVVGRG